jgi:hypothetical protein
MEPARTGSSRIHTRTHLIGALEEGGGSTGAGRMEHQSTGGGSPDHWSREEGAPEFVVRCVETPRGPREHRSSPRGPREHWSREHWSSSCAAPGGGSREHRSLLCAAHREAGARDRGTPRPREQGSPEFAVHRAGRREHQRDPETESRRTEMQEREGVRVRR